MKKLLVLVLALAMVLTMVCTASAEEKAYNIGVTIADLSNPIWSEAMAQVEKRAAEVGCAVTIVDCGNDAATQINQMENFIAQGVDAIMIQASTASAVKDVCQKALDKGVVICAMGVMLENYTTSVGLDNYGAGVLLAQEAAKFINENYGGKTEIGLLTFYGNEECMARGYAYQDTLAELCPESKFVAEASTTDEVEALTFTENFLQAHPDMKVIMSIGDGGAIGANRAVIAAGKADGFAVYGIDGTTEALQIMANMETITAEISFGAGWQMGNYYVDACLNALNNPDDFVKDNVLPNLVVNRENLADRLAEWGYEDQIDMSKMQ